MMSKDRPRSHAEFMALPEGGGFGVRTENGVSVPVAPDVVSFHSEPSDLVTAYERHGDGTRCWALGRYRDGTWFRREVL